jgi:hypothetical protein
MKKQGIMTPLKAYNSLVTESKDMKGDEMSDKNSKDSIKNDQLFQTGYK